MNYGRWIRTEHSGSRSTWVYVRGDFKVEVDCEHRSRLVIWVEGYEVDHFETSEPIRGFIASCWRKHLSRLTYHEFIQYGICGLLTAADFEPEEASQ